MGIGHVKCSQDIVDELFDVLSDNPVVRNLGDSDIT
jgi:hypothetical protein